MTGPRGLFRRPPKLELRADTVLMGCAEIARAVSATALVLSPDGHRFARGDSDNESTEVSAETGEPDARPGVLRPGVLRPGVPR